MIIWLKVSKDKYELPVDVADSAQELARKYGIKANTIHSAAKRYDTGELKSSIWRRVEVEEEE